MGTLFCFSVKFPFSEKNSKFFTIVSHMFTKWEEAKKKIFLLFQYEMQDLQKTSNVAQEKSGCK